MNYIHSLALSGSGGNMRTVIYFYILYFYFNDSIAALCKPKIINIGCEPSPTQVGGSSLKPDPDQICSGDLIFDESFDELNEEVWNHENKVDGCRNGEFEQYLNDRSISYVENGILIILPKIVGDGPLHDGYFNPVQSAKMTTKGKFHFKYGKLETRAKIPAGDWLWPAIWMDPQNSTYGTWPLSGEMDILESRGNKNLISEGENIGPGLMFSTLHWGRNRSENQYKRTHYEKRNISGFDFDYHKYGIEWTPDFIAFSVDDQEIGRVTPPEGGFYELGHLSGDNPWADGGKMAPFDQDFYLIVNVAIGGTSGYFPDNGQNPGGKPWKNWSKQAARDFWNGNEQWRPTWNEQSLQRALKVDYIRIWAI